jgi:ankyrin repeat protein
VDVNSKDNHCQTSLMWAMADGGERFEDPFDIEIVRLILARKKIEINWQLEDGSSALLRAVEYGRSEAVELLGEHGAI